MQWNIFWSEGAFGFYLGVIIAGLPALINLVGNHINLKFNQKKLHAEIIVNERIKFINEIRNLSTKIVTMYLDMEYYAEIKNEINEKGKKLEEKRTELENENENLLKDDKSGTEELTIKFEKLNNDYEDVVKLQDEFSLKIIEIEKEIHINVYLMRTYFSTYKLNKNEVNKNEENIAILEQMIKLIKKGITGMKDGSSSTKDELNEFTKFIADYIKVEWEKIKKLQ